MEDTKESSRSEDDDICEGCGFPKSADREMVLIEDSIVAMSQYLARKCNVCGHQEDGSTIKDKETRLEYGGPPKSNRKGGWYAEIQEDRIYEYKGSTIKVLEENTQTEEKGESVIAEFMSGDSQGEEVVLNRHSFRSMLANNTIETITIGEEE
jgi:hypothetical protein